MSEQKKQVVIFSVVQDPASWSLEGRRLQGSSEGLCSDCDVDCCAMSDVEAWHCALEEEQMGAKDGFCPLVGF